MNPLDHLNAFTRQFTDAKDVFKNMQQWYVKNNPKSGLFVPSIELHGLSPRLALANATGLLKGVTTINTLNDKQYEIIKFLWGLHLFGTWRNTMGVYRIDPDIAADLIASPIPSDTPADIFSRLPEWCVYVEAPENSLSMSTLENKESAVIRGFWALFDMDNGHQVLNLVLNLDQEENSIYSCYQPLTLIVDEDITVSDAVDVALDKNGNLSLLNEEKKLVLHLLSLLLWLCAEEPDISNIKDEPIPRFPPNMPVSRIHKKSGAFVPPSQPIIYDIGKRLGGEIRSFKDQIERSGEIKSSRKRPHIRRGHWHGVWSGAEKSKEFKVYWQSAIFVNSAG
ncbi:AcrVA2 family anti-CRISPR protein [Acinetobacter sp. CFCC 10889]|uniref:AcrVA2 family anti-CRISPR protein n=1 Tax=Acinetobacter sp. CFCC 10889 TaxID=1775557 RepID=UPI000DD0D5DC|nr:hypothetical protein [Acinetobacter sp. CFCC 10889]